jgi:hypothetical protein
MVILLPSTPLQHGDDECSEKDESAFVRKIKYLVCGGNRFCVKTRFVEEREVPSTDEEV